MCVWAALSTHAMDFIDNDGTQVTALDDLIKMMHHDYAGRAAKSRRAHIHFKDLSMPQMQNPLMQEIIQAYWTRIGDRISYYRTMLGIVPYVVTTKTIIHDGRKVAIKTAVILEPGTFDVFVKRNPNMTKSYTIRMRGSKFGSQSHPKIYIAEFRYVDGPSSYNGDVVDSECGNLLHPWRELQFRLAQSQYALKESLNQYTWIERIPISLRKRAETKLSLLQNQHADALVGELEEGKPQETDKYGYRHQKLTTVQVDHEKKIITLPEDYRVCTNQPTLHKAFFETIPSETHYQRMVDIVFNVQTVHTRSDGRNSANIAAMEARERTIVALQEHVDDVIFVMQDIWSTVYPDEDGTIDIQLPYELNIDLETVAMLTDRQIIPMDVAQKHVRKVGRFSTEGSWQTGAGDDDTRFNGEEDGNGIKSRKHGKWEDEPKKGDGKDTDPAKGTAAPAAPVAVEVPSLVSRLNASVGDRHT